MVLVGHAGKLVKAAGGIMNTHSKYADCRMELFCAHAALCGAGVELCRSLMAAATTDACIGLLDGARACALLWWTACFPPSSSTWSGGRQGPTPPAR